MDTTFFFVFIITFVNGIYSDYVCVCSHHTQRGIYGSPSMNSPPLGFLYKDECKAIVAQPNIDKQWVAIQFYHMIAYIETDSGVETVMCQGAISDEDKASTMFPPTTQRTGHTSTIQMSHTVNSWMASFKSTTVSPSSRTTFLTNSRPTSYQQTSLTTSKRKSSQPTIHATQNPSTQRHITQSPTKQHHVSIKTTALSFSIGNLELCPDNVRRGSFINGFKLGQYEHSCYEICNQLVSWFHANEMCKARGGHLVTLSNQNENHFLNMLIKHFYHSKNFWIGLNDLNHEENFIWSSGDHASYRNWIDGRKSSHHYNEDCVVMLYNGHWDDIDCGSSTYYTEYLHPRHPYVCEYGTVNGAVLVG